jgi:hypothetical protein
MTDTVTPIEEGSTGDGAGTSRGRSFPSPLAALRDLVGNPVLRRELDERAASGRAAAAMTAWLVLLSGLAVLVYWSYSAGDGFDPVTNDSARIGKNIFEWTLFGMLGLVLFLVPAFTASAVAGERTRQTLVPVQMTALSPLAIVLGKSLAAIAFTVLLVVAAAPILALAFFVGGVGLADLLSGLGVVILTAVVLGAVGIALSAVFSKVQGATVMTYGFVLAISVGTFILLGVVGIVRAVDHDGFGPTPAPPKELLIPNPFVALADATAGPDDGLGENPLTALRTLVDELETGSIEFDGRVPDEERTALWRWYVVGSALTVYSALAVASGRLRTPAETER